MSSSSPVPRFFPMSQPVPLIGYAEPDVVFAGVQEEREFAQTQRICTQVHALELRCGMFTQNEPAPVTECYITEQPCYRT